MRDIESSNDEESYLKWKAERQYRLRVAMAVVPAIIGFSTVIYTLTNKNIEYYFYYNILRVLGPVSLALSGIAVVMIYLQTGFKRNVGEVADYSKYESELKNLKLRLETNNTASNLDLIKLENEVHGLKITIANIENFQNAITAEDKEKVVNLLKAEILEKSSHEASQEILRNIENQVSTKNYVNEIESVFSKTLDRLYTEIDSLTRRGNLNLSLGVVTTIIGLGILGYFVLTIGAVPDDKMAFIANFIPRLSLVILIEVFAYFFLKLYKSSLSEIKYFQNEMTNIEAKLAAIKSSTIATDKVVLSDVIKSLVSTERNAILEKGQTTAEIERARIEQQNISTISEKVTKILNMKKGG